MTFQRSRVCTTLSRTHRSLLASSSIQEDAVPEDVLSVVPVTWYSHWLDSLIRNLQTPVIAALLTYGRKPRSGTFLFRKTENLRRHPALTAIAWRNGSKEGSKDHSAFHALSCHQSSYFPKRSTCLFEACHGFHALDPDVRVPLTPLVIDYGFVVVLSTGQRSCNSRPLCAAVGLGRSDSMLLQLELTC